MSYVLRRSSKLTKSLALLRVNYYINCVSKKFTGGFAPLLSLIIVFVLALGVAGAVVVINRSQGTQFFSNAGRNQSEAIEESIAAVPADLGLTVVPKLNPEMGKIDLVAKWKNPRSVESEGKLTLSHYKITVRKMPITDYATNLISDYSLAKVLVSENPSRTLTALPVKSGESYYVQLRAIYYNNESKKVLVKVQRVEFEYFEDRFENNLRNWINDSPNSIKPSINNGQLLIETIGPTRDARLVVKPGAIPKIKNRLTPYAVGVTVSGYVNELGLEGGDVSLVGSGTREYGFNFRNTGIPRVYLLVPGGPDNGYYNIPLQPPITLTSYFDGSNFSYLYNFNQIGDSFFAVAPVSSLSLGFSGNGYSVYLDDFRLVWVK